MGAVIGICVMKLGLEDSLSLKDKRSRISSIKEKVRQRFKVVIAETDDLDKIKIAELTLCTVSNDEAVVNSHLDKIIKFVEDLRTTVILDTRIEIIHV